MTAINNMHTPRLTAAFGKVESRVRMAHSLDVQSLANIRKYLYAIVFLILAALLVAGLGTRHVRAPFASAEVQFTDASTHGMQIVPASCPSSPHYTGDCSNGTPGGTPGGGGGGGGGGVVSCPLGYTVSGGACVFVTCPAGYRLAGGVCSQFTCPAGYTVVRDSLGDNCVPPASINFVSFAATNPNGPFTASGHLQVVPILVRSGNSVQVYWSVANASTCTVTGNNGDSWSMNSSGAAGQTSRPVTTQTTFTLSCTSLLGATPPSIHESQVVNIIPVFNEL